MACQAFNHKKFMSSKLTLTNLNDSSLSSFVFFIYHSTLPQYAGQVLKLCIITPKVQMLRGYKENEKLTMRMEDLEEETRIQCLVHNAMLPLRVCPELLLMGHIEKDACMPFLSNLSGNNEVERIKQYVTDNLRGTSSLGYILMEFISPIYGTLHHFDELPDTSILLDRSLRVFALLMSIFIKTKICNTDAHFGNAFALITWDDQVLDPIKIIDFGRVARADNYEPIFIDMETISHDYKFHADAKKNRTFSKKFELAHTYTIEGLTVNSLYTAIRHYVIIDYERNPGRVPKCFDLLMEVFPHLKQLYSSTLETKDMFSDVWFGRGGRECEPHLEFMLNLIKTQEQTRHEKYVRQLNSRHPLESTKRTRRDVEPDRPGRKATVEQGRKATVEQGRPVDRPVDRPESRLLGLSSALTDNQPDEYRPTVAPVTSSISYKTIAGVGMFLVACAYLVSRGASKRKRCHHCKPRKTRRKPRKPRLL